MANDMQRLEKFYDEQIKNQVTFQVGDIVAAIDVTAKRSFPMLVVYVEQGDSADDEPIKTVFFDEDDDLMRRWYSPYRLTLLKRLAE